MTPVCNLVARRQPARIALFGRTTYVASFAVAILACATPAPATDLAIPARFEAAMNFEGGVAPAKDAGKWGLIDRRGEWRIAPKFDAALPGSDGRFGVKVGGKWGFIDARGAMAIEPRFEEIRPFQTGYAPAKLNGKWGFITTTGKTETRFIFTELAGRERMVIAGQRTDPNSTEEEAKKPLRWSLFSAGKSEDDSANTDVERTVKPGAKEPDESDSFMQPIKIYGVSERAAVAVYEDGERLIQITDSGDADKSEPYFSIRRASEGFAAAAKQRGKWGFISSNGDYLWEGRFEDAKMFSEGLAPVKSGGKWGYIARTGEFLVKPDYDDAFPFRNGYAVVRKGDLRGFLKSDAMTGVSVFIAPEFEDALRFTQGLAPVKVGGRWGYVGDGRPEPLVESEVKALNAD